jgi:hypothetical protein
VPSSGIFGPENDVPSLDCPTLPVASVPVSGSLDLSPPASSQQSQQQSQYGVGVVDCPELLDDAKIAFLSFKFQISVFSPPPKKRTLPIPLTVDTFSLPLFKSFILLLSHLLPPASAPIALSFLSYGSAHSHQLKGSTN